MTAPSAHTPPSHRPGPLTGEITAWQRQDEGYWEGVDHQAEEMKVQAVHGMAMTGVQEPDLDEQRRGPAHEEEEEEEEEEGGKVHVTVEGEHRAEDEEDGEEEGEGEEEDELPYPSLAPVVLLALTQTSPPRSWCLRAVCHPYPSPAVL
ncbi:Voltage-dependent T-type calcium channel subunit alpha-1G [Oryzias melastigma]|uniref:Voltage-dependent T-type calcium channel subunit alpha-1G n=1 Tax=Oryzias melastigma TaxID=30732 RepID=A0A834KZI9_ORYME|nr:Voltage-dependent T-type calcium channel subunit alpha-1G [Oryzias melastigma]